MKSKTFLACAALLIGTSFSAVAAGPALNTISEATVAKAFTKLGHAVSSFKDVEGEPHLVLTSKVEGVKDIAVYFDDCTDGKCEDLTFYANFGAAKVSDEQINAWNHIGTKNRSKAFRMDDGTVGLVYSVSYYGDDDGEAVAMISGLFLLEAELFGVMTNL